MSDAQSTEPVGLDKHDPAGMARWLRERQAACLEFYKLDSEAQQRQYLNRWQQNVLPHLAFRFQQAAEMVEQQAAEIERLRNKVVAMTLVAYGTPEYPRDPLSATDVPAKCSGDGCPGCSACMKPSDTPAEQRRDEHA